MENVFVKKGQRGHKLCNTSFKLGKSLNITNKGNQTLWATRVSKSRSNTV